MAVKKKAAPKKTATKRKAGVGSKFKTTNAPTMKKKKPAKAATKPAAPKKPGTRKPKLSAADQKKKAARAKVTGDRLKGKKTKTIKQKLAERVAKHGEAMANAKEAFAKKKALVEKSQKVAQGNLVKKQKAALINLTRAYNARMKAKKSSKPKIKDGKIVVAKAEKATFKKVTPKLTKLPSLRTTKGAVKKRSGASAGAKKAGKTRAKNKNKATRAA